MAIATRPETGLQEVPLSWIRPSLLNPRKHFDEAALAHLAESIKAEGIQQPIVVREWHDEHINGTAFEIIAGERRYRAAKLAGLTTVPVINRGRISDEAALRLAIVENLEREDLDPIEEAEGFAALNRLAGMRQSEIAAAVKRSQPAIANRMRLLELPDEVREMIRRGELSPSHGVALAAWAKFPDLVRVAARLAIKLRSSSKDIEGDRILGWWQILDKTDDGILAAVQVQRYEVDISVCKTCPFEAYHERQYREICLNPAHYEELKQARQKDIEERAKARQEAVATDDAEAAQANPGLPNMRQMPYNSYVDLHGRGNLDGCTEACPCRGQAIDHANRVVPICLDPKRHSQLERAATREANKARKRDAADLRTRVTKQIDALTEIGPAEVALLCHRAVSSRFSYSAPNSQVWDDARARHKLKGGKGTELDSIAAMVRRSGGLLAAKVALEALLVDELNHYSEEGGTPALSRFWLEAHDHPESLLPREEGDPE